MATQINAVLNNEALDRALVQCLRLFTQHGRKVRSQKPPTDEKLSDIVKIKNGLENPNGKEAG